MKRSLMRTLAVSSVAAAAMIAGFSGLAAAQTLAATKGADSPAALAATSINPEKVEQRISWLKTALKITPEQEAKWEGVAKAIRENAAAMDRFVQKTDGKKSALNAVEDLKTFQEFSQLRVDGLKNLITPFKALYESMPPDQKKTADGIFESYGWAKWAQQG